MKKNLLTRLAVVVVMLLGTATIANATGTQLTTNINMDNGFEAFLSTDDNAQGTAFSSGHDYTTTISGSTTLTQGVDYFLHIYGFDDDDQAGFLGAFTLSGTDHYFDNNTNSLLTNTTDWQVSESGWGGYTTPTSLGLNGSGQWAINLGGSVSGIPTEATWIWSDNSWLDNTAYFSTKITANAVPVPEPASMFLLGSGLACAVGGLRKKKI